MGPTFKKKKKKKGTQAHKREHKPQILNKIHGGSATLRDAHVQLYCLSSGLRFSEGLLRWKVFDSEMKEHSNYDKVPDRFKSQLHPGKKWIDTPHLLTFITRPVLGITSEFDGY